MISLFLTFCGSLIPIPNRPSGIKFGPASAPINIELFIDITCPSCAAEYNIIKRVLAAYPTEINVNFHFFELPSHTWSYLLTRTIFAVAKENDDFAKQMMDGLLGNYDQSQFYALALMEYGEEKVYELAKQYAIEKTGIDRDTFDVNYDDSSVIKNTRIEFKYSLIRNLKGTPTVYINGVESTLGGYTFDEWKDIIDSLLN